MKCGGCVSCGGESCVIQRQRPPITQGAANPPAQLPWRRHYLFSPKTATPHSGVDHQSGQAAAMTQPRCAKQMRTKPSFNSTCDNEQENENTDKRWCSEVICSIQLMSLWSSKRPANIQLWYKSREKPRTQNPDRLPLSLQTKKTHEVTTP